MDMRIKDPSLYPSGLDKIEWVKRNMHLLNTIERSFIEEQPFKEGDLVEKGAVLFEIEKIRYQATLEASKAKIESIKAKNDLMNYQIKE